MIAAGSAKLASVPSGGGGGGGGAAPAAGGAPAAGKKEEKKVRVPFIELDTRRGDQRGRVVLDGRAAPSATERVLKRWPTSARGEGCQCTHHHARGGSASDPRPHRRRLFAQHLRLGAVRGGGRAGRGPDCGGRRGGERRGRAFTGT